MRQGFHRGVAAAVGVGAGIRVAQVLWWRPTCPNLNVQGPGGCFKIAGDALYGYWQAELLAKGHWFKDPVAYYLGDGSLREAAGKPPLYPGTLALFRLVGLDTPTSQRLALAAVGVLAIGLIGWCGREVGGPQVGVIAAWIAALHPLLWINDGMLQVESLYTAVIAVMILSAYRWWRQPCWRRWWPLAVSLGVAAMLRAEAQLLLPALMVPLAWRTRGLLRRDRVVAVLAAAAVCVAMWAPWLIWNQMRFERAPLGAMTVGSGAVLVSAYCDVTFYGEALGYWGAHCFTRDLPEDLDASEVDAIQREQALSYAREHLGRLPVVVLARIGRMYDLYRPFDTLRLNAQVEGRGWVPSALGLAASWALLPVAVAGLVVLWRRRVTLIPLLSQVAVVTVTAAATFGVTRYRVPVDVVMVVAASVALGAIAERRLAVTQYGDETQHSMEAVRA